MPCLFFRNVPTRREWDPNACRVLYGKVAYAARVSVEDVEVHIEDTQYRLLEIDGQFALGRGVHVFVEWFEGRSGEAKDAIAEAIHEFLVHHGLGKGSDITFRDSPAGTFYFEGKLIPGGPPRTCTCEGCG